MRRTEAGGRVATVDPEHRMNAVLDSPMALFQQMIGVRGRANGRTEHEPDSPTEQPWRSEGTRRRLRFVLRRAPRQQPYPPPSRRNTPRVPTSAVCRWSAASAGEPRLLLAKTLMERTPTARSLAGPHLSTVQRLYGTRVHRIRLGKVSNVVSGNRCRVLQNEPVHAFTARGRRE
jgi:hypothetical protein